MPVPLIAGLLLGGLGLSAGRSVFANKKAGRQAATFDQALGAAGRLEPQQRAMIKSIFSVNQQEGLDLLDQTLARNLQREQLAQAATFATESAEDRAANLALRQREANQKRRQLDQATDPRVTGAALARQGLRVIGTPEQIAAGEFSVAPIPGTDKHGVGEAQFQSVADALDNVNVLSESLARAGAVTDINDPEAQIQAFSYQRMIAGMKAVLETGALAAFEAEMVQRAIADPQSVFNQIMGGGDDKARISTQLFRELIEKSAQRQVRDKRDFQLDPQDLQFMNTQLTRARQNIPVFTPPGQAAAPGTVPIGTGGSDVGAFTEQLALQAQILNANLGGDVQKSADLQTRLRQLQRQGEDVGAGRALLPGGGPVQEFGRTVFDLIKAF